MVNLLFGVCRELSGLLPKKTCQGVRILLLAPCHITIFLCVLSPYFLYPLILQSQQMQIFFYMLSCIILFSPLKVLTESDHSLYLMLFLCISLLKFNTSNGKAINDFSCVSTMSYFVVDEKCSMFQFYVPSQHRTNYCKLTMLFYLTPQVFW